LRHPDTGKRWFGDVRERRKEPPAGFQPEVSVGGLHQQREDPGLCRDGITELIRSQPKGLLSKL